MIRRTFVAWPSVAVALVAMSGCTNPQETFLRGKTGVADYKNAATQIEYPDVCVSKLSEAATSLAPRTLRSAPAEQIWDLGLEEAVRIALCNSKVMRDLGGRVVNAPATIGTVYQPAIQESDPRYGVEGALSAFDAQLFGDLTYDNNDRPVNQVVPGFSLPVFQQQLGTFNAGVRKTNATGGTWTFSNNTVYEANNNPNNQFPSWFTTQFNAEFRQPLLQGAGVEFNRIAGPNASPGFYFSTGVMIARVNNDIALADFEASVVRLVSDVENAYWDLYYAYRDLDAKIAGRDSALRTWQRVEALMKSGSPGGEAENESQAREQYFLFRGLVEDALSGLPGGSTQAGSGSSAGQFRGVGGVYAREGNLRFLMGLAANDGRLIRPGDEPTLARVEFPWDEIVAEGHARRVELRRQRWLIKRRELELIASRNFLMPRLDAVGRYRWRGLGDQLISQSDQQYSSAFQNLSTGDFQESEVGLTFSMPLGQRQAMAGVRNAELNLARERTVLQEQELQVSHDMSGALRELDRAYQLAQTNFNRRLASQRQVEATQAAREAGRVTLDVVLDAQRRLADSESAYYRSVLEYNLAIKSIHFEKGSLLDYNNVFLAEGPWPQKAYSDAAKQYNRRLHAERINYAFTKPSVVSAGLVPQGVNGAAGDATIVEGDLQPQVITDPGATIRSTPNPVQGRPTTPGDLDRRIPSPRDLPSPGDTRNDKAKGPLERGLVQKINAGAASQPVPAPYGTARPRPASTEPKSAKTAAPAKTAVALDVLDPPEAANPATRLPTVGSAILPVRHEQPIPTVKP